MACTEEVLIYRDGEIQLGYDGKGEWKNFKPKESDKQ